MPKYREGNVYSLNTEKNLLAIAIHEVDFRGLIFYRMDDRYFFEPQHQIIFREMQEIYNQNNQFDCAILFDKIKNAGLIQYIKGELKDSIYNTTNLDSYIEDLTVKFLLRSAYQIAEDFCREVETGKNLDTELISKVTAELIRLTSEESLDIDIDTLIEEFKEYYEEQKKSKVKLLGFSTGMKKLDSITNGIKPGELTLIGGQTSTGKTSLGLNFAINILNQDIPILILTLEMTKNDVLERLLSIISGIALTPIQLARVSARDETKIQNILANLKKKKMFINDKMLNLNKILSLIRTAHIQNQIRFVLLDYIQYVPNTFSKDDYIKLTRSISQLSKELNIAIVAISQFSRYIDRREDDYRPRLSDLKESGSLEQDSAMAILLHYPFRRTRKQDQEKDLYAYVDKNRRGEIGEVKLQFEKVNQRITDSISYPKNPFNELINDALSGDVAGII